MGAWQDILGNLRKVNLWLPERSIQLQGKGNSMATQSTAAADGQVATADGTGAVAWETPASGGAAVGNATPLMDGTATAGVSTAASREDHVHPVDTSRAATSHTHAQADVTSLVADLALKAPLASPTFTGTVEATGATSVKVPTVAIGTGSNAATIGAVNTALGAYLTTASASSTYATIASVTSEADTRAAADVAVQQDVDDLADDFGVHHHDARYYLEAETDALLVTNASNDRARGNHTGTQLAATVSDFDTQVRTSKIHQMTTPTAATPMGGQILTGLGAGAAAGDSLRYEQLVGLYLLLTGGTLSGAMTVSNGVAKSTTNFDGVGFYKAVADANPAAALGVGAEGTLSFGPGGASGYDWTMSRTAADIVALDAGDKLQQSTMPTAAADLVNHAQYSKLEQRLDDQVDDYGAHQHTALFDANAAADRARANHTGTQAATTVSVSAITNLTATEVQAALAEHQLDIDGLTSGSGIPGSTMDAKGDLIVGTADNAYARRAAPSVGMGIAADSTQTDGWRNEQFATRQALDDFREEFDGHYHYGGLRRYKSIVAGLETFDPGAAYAWATTPDRVQNVILATSGILRIGFVGEVKSTKAFAMAIFIGANQLRVQQSSGAPTVQEVTRVATTLFELVVSGPHGLIFPGAATSDQTQVTTGQALANTTNGGFVEVYAAAGTYDIGVMHKNTSGVAATTSWQSRKLWVEAIEF